MTRNELWKGLQCGYTVHVHRYITLQRPYLIGDLSVSYRPSSFRRNVRRPWRTIQYTAISMATNLSYSILDVFNLKMNRTTILSSCCHQSSLLSWHDEEAHPRIVPSVISSCKYDLGGLRFAALTTTAASRPTVLVTRADLVSSTACDPCFNYFPTRAGTTYPSLFVPSSSFKHPSHRITAHAIRRYLPTAL